jgi:GNAT superfamily N-acetyltransferase
MITIRMATVDDARLIAVQRQRMFVDSGQAEGEAMLRMVENFVDWVEPRLKDGTYLGWLMEEGGAVIAGAGMWLIDFPPHWMHEEPVRAYLLNFYVEPAARGRGLAQQMLDLTLQEARRRGIVVVSLHASRLGRPIYERNGFEGTNEMMLRLG